MVNTNGSGHGALAGLLSALGVDALICRGIGGGAEDTAFCSKSVRDNPPRVHQKIRVARLGFFIYYEAMYRVAIKWVGKFETKTIYAVISANLYLVLW